GGGGGGHGRAGAARSIREADEAVELLPRERVARLDGDGALQLADGFADLVLPRVDASEVEEGEVAGFVARSRLGALQPLHRFVSSTELDQVRADVVVGIAE